VSSRSVKRVLIVEDSYLVHRISVENGCYVQRREPMENGESQCVEKNFCMSPLPPDGGRQRAKLKNRKSKIAKNRKSEFLAFAEKRREGQKSEDRASLFGGYRRSQKRTSACRIFNTALNGIILASRYRSFRELKVSRSTWWSAFE
jgi:hypothetical protein